MSHDELLAAALNLNRQERAALAQTLLSSLDGTEQSTPALEEIWLEESERRLGQVLDGQVTTIPSETAFQKVRQALG